MTYKVKSGNHLGTVRQWIQRHASNGAHVIFGSRKEFLKLYALTPHDLDWLAQMIRDAVLNELKVKDCDHQYKYCVISEGIAFQDADNIEEVWRCLFKAEGHVTIREVNHLSHGSMGNERSLGNEIFCGNHQEAMEWCLLKRKNNEDI
jgi:hypothetical protein